jgi:hypothetical protein
MRLSLPGCANTGKSTTSLAMTWARRSSPRRSRILSHITLIILKIFDILHYLVLNAENLIGECQMGTQLTHPLDCLQLYF